MKPLQNISRTEARPGHCTGSTRAVAMAAVFFVAGVVVSGLWFSRGAGRGAGVEAEVQSPGVAGLSEASKSFLQRLELPVELHYYSLFDKASANAPAQAFATRVDQMLAQYAQASGGKIKVVRVDAPSTDSANAALGDGLKPFDLDKGDGSYLGIAVVCKQKKESLDMLAPEWEPALESDLTRAIARVVAANPAPTPPPPVDTASLETVKSTIPNFGTVSVKEGTRFLRQSAIDQIQQVSQDMDSRVKQAEQEVLAAQNSQSEAQIQAAVQQLKKAQAEQLARLAQIATSTKSQIAALQQLKGGDH